SRPRPRAAAEARTRARLRLRAGASVPAAGAARGSSRTRRVRAAAVRAPVPPARQAPLRFLAQLRQQLRGSIPAWIVSAAGGSKLGTAVLMAGVGWEFLGWPAGPAGTTTPAPSRGSSTAGATGTASALLHVGSVG